MFRNTRQRKKVWSMTSHTVSQLTCVCCVAGALEAQRVKYEEELAKLKEQLESNTSLPTPPVPKYKITT